MDLDAPLGRYLKEFNTPAFQGVTVRRLLTHSGGPADLPSREAMARRFPGGGAMLARAGLAVAPGTPVRLQRHRLHPARRARSSRERRAARPVRAEALLHAARHAPHDVPAAQSRGGARIAPTEIVDGGGRSAASSTTAMRGSSAAWPATPGFSRRPTTSRGSAGCCSSGGALDGRRYLDGGDRPRHVHAARSSAR